MTDLDFESSQLQLLTDALRAGPGTPEWRAAMESLEGAPTGVPAQEYKLLYAARERLASGRQYREVRAGPGFTRRVFEAIEKEDDAPGIAPRAVPAANLIAGLSALVILGVLAVVAWLIIPQRSAEEQGPSDLAQTYFVNRLEETTFATGLGADWTAFGKLPVEARSGLRPDVAPEAPATFIGGGATYRRSIDAAQPFALEASVKLGRLSDDVVVQVFVTDTATFDGDSATTPHELVWNLRGAEASVVLPDGTIESATGGASRVRDGQRLDVRITANLADAAVEMNGRRLWSGPNQLGADKPRTLGVRFLTQGKIPGKETPVIEAVRVLVPQKQ